MAYDIKYYGGIVATTGTPANTVGQNGDYALDLTTTGGPFIYLKTAGVWSAATSLKGVTGTAGSNGTNGTNGTNGAPGNLVNVVTVTGAYTVTSSNVTGGILYIRANAATANCPITIDAATLWQGGTSQSYLVIIKRIDSSLTYGVTIVAGGTSETVDGQTSVAVLPLCSREVIAASATALDIN